MRTREPLIRCFVAVETRERLVTRNAAGRQVDDRLEDNAQCFGGLEDGADLPAPLPRGDIPRKVGGAEP